ncbi:MAG: HDOD domain-containing protein [Thermodesulfobacteriota bacterium]
MSITKSHSLLLVSEDPVHWQAGKAAFGVWDHLVYFCGAPQEALAILAGVSADVVLVHLGPRLPPMEAFLARIYTRYPNTIRYVCGGPERALAMGRMVAAGLAHRLAVLPQDFESMLAAVRQDLDTRSRLRTRRAWDYLRLGARLPVRPVVVASVERLLADPACGVPQIASAISEDPVIASRLLQVANTPAFARGQAVGDLEQAVSILGLDQIRELIVMVQTMEMFPVTGACQKRLDEVIAHSSSCAKLAAIIARRVLPAHARLAASAALFHDMGKLAIYASDCARYLAAQEDERCRTRRRPSSEVEEDCLGISHASLGSAILLWWNLPMTIVDAVGGHNQALTNLVGPSRVVALADRLLVEAESGAQIHTDLDSVAHLMPIDLWRREAQRLVAG